MTTTRTLSPAISARRLGKRNGYEVLELFIGPQHPASGHMRLIVYLDGDIIVDVDPDIGYVHRAMEKLAESREYVKIIPLLERTTIIDACNITLGLVEAIEKLMGIDVPARAKYLRTILCEINRIASHLYGLGIGSIMLNHSTMYMWAFGDREVWLTLMEIMAGARLTHTYSVPGGVRRDLPQIFKDYFARAKRYMERRLAEYEQIFLRNPLVRDRLENIGVLDKHKAIEYGIVGPNLRATGVKYDARLLGYEAYGELDFEPIVGEHGDALERIRVRLEEIRVSMQIVEEALKRLPEGPYFSEKLLRLLPPKLKQIVKNGRLKLPGSYVRMKPGVGEVFTRVEAGRGEVTYYVYSKGDIKPYRVRVVTPSARNVVLLRLLVKGEKLMDLPAVYASLDYFPPEADR